MRLAFLGLFSIWLSSMALSGPTPGGIPADTGDSGSWDSGATDSGYTGDDSGYAGDSGYIGDDSGYIGDDSGYTGDSGGSSWGDDTGDSGSADWTEGSSASELAGEEGGFSCASAPARGGLPLLIFGAMLLGFRRRE